MPEPEIGQAGGTNPRGVWELIRQHSGLALASFAALAAAWYLFMRPSSGSSTAAKPVNIPGLGSGGGGSAGGGGSTGGGGGATSANTPTRPFNPDFELLNGIFDTGYRALVERAYNLEVQINDATVSGNTSLINSLASQLGNVQDQIRQYALVDPSSTIASLTSKVTDLTGQLARAVASGTADASTISALQASIATLNAQISDLRNNAATHITASAVQQFQSDFSSRFPHLYETVWNAANGSLDYRTSGPNSGVSIPYALTDVYGRFASGIRAAAIAGGMDTSKLTNQNLVALWNNFQSNSGAYSQPTYTAAAIQSYINQVNAGLIAVPGQIEIRTATGVVVLPANYAFGNTDLPPFRPRGQTSVNRNLVRGR